MKAARTSRNSSPRAVFVQEHQADFLPFSISGAVPDDDPKSASQENLVRVFFFFFSFLLIMFVLLAAVCTTSEDRLEEPDVGEQEDDGDEEAEPHPPAHAGALGHEQHAVHGAAQPETGLVERVIHLLGEGGRVADFVSDGHRHLAAGAACVSRQR